MGYHAEAYYLTSHGDDPEMLSSPEDVDAFIDRLLEQPIENNLAEMYLVERLQPEESFPNHQFYVGVDRERGVGALKFNDADGGFASWAPWDAEADSPSYYCLMGNETEFPAGSDVPIDFVRRAVKEFLASGGQRPTSVQWQEDTTL